MANYYFLAPSLSPLKQGEWPDLTFEELIERFVINLTPVDFEKTKSIRRYIDFLNIRSRLLGDPIDPRGNLTEKELDDAILSESGLPDYFFAFMKQYPIPHERIRNMALLFSSFFQDEIERHSGFLHDYFKFEREWRLVLVALRAKKGGRDLAEELKYEDPTDPFVERILAQKETPSFDPPKRYVDLKKKFLSCGSDPWEYYKTFSEWRFNRIVELAKGPLFSLDCAPFRMTRHNA